jgi:DNA-binding response OmpR family regulator
MDKWRILAIDDDPGTLDLVTMALEDNYAIITLSNPIEALDVAKVFEPDLMILDLMMPKVDGYHLLDVFRRDRGLKDLPVIILSAKKNKRDIQFGYQVGAVLYLTKPFQPTRLRRNIDFLFEHNPPTRRVKHLTFNQVLSQIQLLRCFKEGTIGFPSHILTQVVEEKKEKKVEKPSGYTAQPESEPKEEAPPPGKNNMLWLD